MLILLKPLTLKAFDFVKLLLQEYKLCAFISSNVTTDKLKKPINRYDHNKSNKIPGRKQCKLMLY